LAPFIATEGTPAPSAPARPPPARAAPSEPAAPAVAGGWLRTLFGWLGHGQKQEPAPEPPRRVRTPRPPDRAPVEVAGPTEEPAEAAVVGPLQERRRVLEARLLDAPDPADAAGR